MTGDMMKRLTNSAMPAITWLGGTLLRPSALRVMDRTTKTLVKAVVMSSSDGAIDSRVSRMMMVIDWLGCTPPTSMLTVPSGGLGDGVGAARAEPGESSTVPATRTATQD